MKRGLVMLAALLAALLAITAWALESGGVAVVETLEPDGSVRSTHVWYVETDGALWLEAGTPENGWFVDALRNPELRLEAAGRSGRYSAHPVVDAASHAGIRSLIREKYGLRDWWVGFLIVDSSQSVAVRLDPLPAGAQR